MLQMHCAVPLDPVNPPVCDKIGCHIQGGGPYDVTLGCSAELPLCRKGWTDN